MIDEAALEAPVSLPSEEKPPRPRRRLPLSAVLEALGVVLVVVLVVLRLS